MKLDTRLMLFMALVTTFLTCLLVGNLMGGKLTHLDLTGATDLPVLRWFARDWVISVGEIPFPLTFILTDILNEFYGRKVARRVTLLGAGAIGLAIALIQLADTTPWFPPAYGPDWGASGNMTPAAFDNVFMSAVTIQMASLVAFLTANYVDITVFFLIKKVTKERFLWLRATGSTAVSQMIDTILVVSIAFGTKQPTSVLVDIIITSYVVKVAVAILVTPVIYGLHSLLEKAWHLHPLPVEASTGDVGGAPGDDKA